MYSQHKYELIKLLARTAIGQYIKRRRGNMYIISHQEIIINKEEMLGNDETGYVDEDGWQDDKHYVCLR